MKILLLLTEWVEPVDKLTLTGLRRCQKTLELWQKGNYHRILITGGFVESKNIQTKPLSIIAKEWLMQNGINGELIYIEDRSVDTCENIKYTLDILEMLKIEKPQITIVSSWFHTIRAWVICRLGYKVSMKIKPIFHKLFSFNSLVEIVFILYTLFDPKGKYIYKIIRQKRKQRAGSTL